MILLKFKWNKPVNEIRLKCSKQFVFKENIITIEGKDTCFTELQVYQKMLFDENRINPADILAIFSIIFCAVLLMQ